MRELVRSDRQSGQKFRQHLPIYRGLTQVCKLRPEKVNIGFVAGVGRDAPHKE